MKNDDTLNLNKREISIILGCLNDAIGYPYQKYEPGVESKSEDFKVLFDKIHKNGKIESEDVSLVLLTLEQAFKHMDQDTLFATQDDVTLQEIDILIKKLGQGRDDE